MGEDSLPRPRPNRASESHRLQPTGPQPPPLGPGAVPELDTAAGREMTRSTSRVAQSGQATSASSVRRNRKASNTFPQARHAYS